MTRTLTAACAAAALFAAPGYAFAASETGANQNAQNAQQTGQQTGNMQSGDQTGSGQQSGSGEKSWQSGSGQQMTGDKVQGSAMSSEQREQMVASQQDVRDKLSGAGFSNVEVLNAAYLVSAKAPNGEDVMMMIDASRQMGETGQGSRSRQLNDSMQRGNESGQSGSGEMQSESQ